MIDHELTDPTGSALTITHNVDGVWVTATEDRDEVTVGPFPARTLRASFDMGDDLMDGGVTAAAIEAEVVSPERARSLVQELDEARSDLIAAERGEQEATEHAEREERRAEGWKEIAKNERSRTEKAERELAEARKIIDARMTGTRTSTFSGVDLNMTRRAMRVLHGMGYMLSEAVTADALHAALTEPPARPEGAEEIEEDLRALVAETDANVPIDEAMDVPAWADHLAAMGYRKAES